MSGIILFFTDNRFLSKILLKEVWATNKNGDKFPIKIVRDAPEQKRFELDWETPEDVPNIIQLEFNFA